MVRPGAAPKVPLGHAVQAPDPAPEYVPAGHRDAVAFMAPAGHAYPGAHAPLQVADVWPVVLPNRPAGHALHALAAVEENVPAGQMDPVALVVPAAHAYPAGHSPVQLEFVRPLVSPKRPGAHMLHTEAPAAAYVPGAQMVAVALAVPAAQAYPAGHRPVQLGVIRPLVLPKDPAGHTLQAPAPPTENCPGAHTTAVALMDPRGHAYPGAQGPVQLADARPLVSPYCPAGHSPVQLSVVRPLVLPKRPTGHTAHALEPATE